MKSFEEKKVKKICQKKKTKTKIGKKVKLPSTRASWN